MAPLPARHLAGDSRGGGLLGQGSILTVTSYPDADVAGHPRQVDLEKLLGATAADRRRTCLR